MGGVHALDGVAERVHVPTALASDHAAEDHPFPWGVEDRLVRLDLDGSEAVHAAEIVDAVHDPRRPLARWRARVIARTGACFVLERG